MADDPGGRVSARHGQQDGEPLPRTPSTATSTSSSSQRRGPRAGQPHHGQRLVRFCQGGEVHERFGPPEFDDAVYEGAAGGSQAQAPIPAGPWSTHGCGTAAVRAIRWGLGLPIGGPGRATAPSRCGGTGRRRAGGGDPSGDDGPRTGGCAPTPGEVISRGEGKRGTGVCRRPQKPQLPRFKEHRHEENGTTATTSPGQLR